MADEKYLKKIFKIRIGKKLDLSNPKTFNEKLQWLKLYDRKPEYTAMVDKIEAKKIAAEKIGYEHIIPTLGVFDKFDDIDFDGLPNSFVIKCSHDSGGLFIVKDKNTFDKNAAKRKIEKCLKHNYFYGSREWPYKNVKPRILVEEYVEHEKDLPDYKFFCFDGKVKILFVATGRFTDKRFDYFDENYNVIDMVRGAPVSDVPPPRPENFEKMKALAEKLSEGIPFIRIDLYDIKTNILFGEFTFYPGSGLVKITPARWDEKLGEYLTLPKGEK